MQVIVTEGDSLLFNDNLPRLVILKVQKGGKTVDIPYPADKTIQQMFKDLNTMSNNLNIECSKVEQLPLEDKQEVMNTDKIERGDIVRCVKVYPRDEGSGIELFVGQEYRILSVVEKKGKAERYDILDDNAPMRMRISVFPDEVELVKKKEKTPPRAIVKSIYKKCSICHEENILYKESENEYAATCEKCGARLVEIVGVSNG